MPERFSVGIAVVPMILRPSSRVFWTMLLWKPRDWGREIRLGAGQWVGGEANRDPETGEGDDGEDDHRRDVGPVARHEVGDQDRARDRGAEG